MADTFGIHFGVFAANLLFETQIAHIITVITAIALVAISSTKSAVYNAAISKAADSNFKQGY